MKYITDILSAKLLTLNLITEAQLPVFNYGLEVLISSFINILTILCCSCLFNTVFHGIVFLIIFVPLRVTLGGYHAKTRTKCFIISVLLYGITSKLQVALSGILLNSIVWITLLTILSIYILLSKPIDNIHHPINQSKKHKNKSLSVNFIFFDFVVCFIGILSFPNSSLMQFSILSILAFALLHFISGRRCLYGIL